MKPIDHRSSSKGPTFLPLIFICDPSWHPTYFIHDACWVLWSILIIFALLGRIVWDRSKTCLFVWYIKGEMLFPNSIDLLRIELWYCCKRRTLLCKNEGRRHSLNWQHFIMRVQLLNSFIYLESVGILDLLVDKILYLSKILIQLWG